MGIGKVKYQAKQSKNLGELLPGIQKKSQGKGSLQRKGANTGISGKKIT